MSDDSIPPPPSDFEPPTVSIPPPGLSTMPAAAPNAPPPGYVAYQPTGTALRPALQNTKGLATATMTLMWITTAAAFLSAITQFQRKSVWDDRFASFADLSDADNAVAAAGAANVLALIATAIVLCIWTLRAVRNAQKLGAHGVRPGLASGGWFIPFGNAFVPFKQLRAASDSVGSRTSHLHLWQAGWVTILLIGMVQQFGFSEPNAFDQAAISSSLGSESWAALLNAIASVVAAFGAMKAMRTLDSGIAARAAT